MSVLQRWDEIYGNKIANEMLHKIWEKTNKYLFFEYPNPVSSTKMRKTLSFLGSSEDECQENIKKMLQNLKNSEVKLLGYLPIFPASATKLGDSKGNILPDCFLPANAIMLVIYYSF